MLGGRPARGLSRPRATCCIRRPATAATPACTRHLVYDAATKFLAGNRVELTDRATQCLTSFSLDFERHSINTTAGPDMTVNSVSINGAPAKFTFVQPTYAGDPNGQNDPSPAAHEASQNNPVGGPSNNPLPPACAPQLPNTDAAAGFAERHPVPGQQARHHPVSPRSGTGRRSPSRSGTPARPGVHQDGDGTTEGWFRAPDGGFVTTEPVGSEDWMPLNDYPSGQADLRLLRHGRPRAGP